MSLLLSDILIVTLFFIVLIVGSLAIIKLSKNRTRKISNLRTYVQIMAVIAIFMGLLLGPFNQELWRPLGISPRDRLIGAELFGTQFPDGLSVPVLACYYPNGRTVTCTIWQMQAYVFPFWDYPRGYQVFYSTSGLEKLLIVLGTTIIMSLILGRFFCGWLCPFGLYMDLLTKIRKAFKKRHLSLSPKVNSALGQSRFIIIALFMILSIIFGSYAIFGAELIPGTIPGGPEGTEAGIVGNINEPFCLICPMRPLCVMVECATGYMDFSYVSQITYGPFYITGFYITSINLSVLIIITILSFAYRRFWCRICPLGGLTALFSSYRPFRYIALTKIEKNREKCTKCGVCKRVCPTQVTEIYDRRGGDVTVANCMLCMRCVEMCPYEGALEAKFAGKRVLSSHNWLK